MADGPARRTPDEIRAMREARRAFRAKRAERKKAAIYSSGEYWQDRMDLLYYGYVDFIMRTLAREARSHLDVGTANCPYQEWFDWIPERISFDRAPPYASGTVTGIEGDFMTYDFARRFDVVTCLQVLEHVPEAEAFTRRLMALGDLVILSVPFMWPAFMLEDHVHDPVSLEKVVGWAGREPNYQIVVEEPFRSRKRLIAVFDTREAGAVWGKKDVHKRVRREARLAKSVLPQRG